MMKTLYRARYVLPIGSDVIENGEVLVEGGLIREVGRGIEAKHSDAAVEDLGRAALLPGFVNAHSHIEYTFDRNKHDGLNLWDWIARIGFKRGTTPPLELVLASARLGAAMCLRSGITCVGDSAFTGVAARAMSELGLSGVVHKEIFGQSLGAEYPAKFARALEDVRELQAEVGERIRIGLSPHAVYTTNPEVLSLCAQSCAELSIPIAMHLAETSAEAEYTRLGQGPIAAWRKTLDREPMVSGLRPAEVLLRAGLLRDGVVLAHCIHLTADEVKIIGGSGAAVAHCPRSNARLGGGIAPVPALLRAGAVVGLGTDSTASCGEIDFFDEMRMALGVHRAASEDAGVLLAKQVLEMATAGGAAALGMTDVGTLAPGMRADMIAVDMDGALPGEDVHLALLSRSPADVKAVFVHGRPVEVDIEARNQEMREMMEQAGIA